MVGLLDSLVLVTRQITLPTYYTIIKPSHLPCQQCTTQINRTSKGKIMWSNDHHRSSHHQYLAVRLRLRWVRPSEITHMLMEALFHLKDGLSKTDCNQIFLQSQTCRIYSSKKKSRWWWPLGIGSLILSKRALHRLKHLRWKTAIPLSTKPRSCLWAHQEL